MYYPVNLDLRGKKCLVVGGGKVALQKVKGLLRGGAFPTVVAPRLEGELLKLGSQRKIHLIRDRFRAKYLKNQFLAIVATDDREANSEIAARCRRQNLLVNVVDQPADCTFTVPSVFRRGSLTIAIATNGASPALSKKIRKDLEKLYGREFGEFVGLLAGLRKEVLRKIPSQSLRKKLFEKVIASDALFLIRKGKRHRARERVREILFGGIAP